MKELWACGFNAWNQLQFTDAIFSAEDSTRFTCILRDEGHIDVVHASFSGTLATAGMSLLTAGMVDDSPSDHVVKKSWPIKVAIAGNDKIAKLGRYGSNLQEYGSLEHYTNIESQVEPPSYEKIVKECAFDLTFVSDNCNFLIDTFTGHVKQIVANQTCFTILSSEGTVWTWGDGRFEATLGREVTETSPAKLPCLVEALLDLPTGPIKKISSGGYMTAAITTGNDMYLWGHRLPGLEPLGEWDIVSAIDLDGHDISDVGIGDNHIIAMTTDYKVFVLGTNSNGQLGCDASLLANWEQIILPIKQTQRVYGVHAGYKNTFILVEDV